MLILFYVYLIEHPHSVQHILVILASFFSILSVDQIEGNIVQQFRKIGPTTWLVKTMPRLSKSVVMA